MLESILCFGHSLFPVFGSVGGVCSLVLESVLCFGILLPVFCSADGV